MSEGQLTDRVLDGLETDFNIRRQVYGSHFSGKRLRIDAIVTPKDGAGWKDCNPALGIEFKDTLRLKDDTRNFTHWLGQCVDYASTEWDEFGYLYVFTCPGLGGGLRKYEAQGDGTQLLPRIMSCLGIGELRRSRFYGPTFYLHQSHRVWSKRRGVEEGRRWSLTRKFGSR